MSARNLREAAITILYWVAVLVLSIILAGVAFFLAGGAAAYLCLLGSIGAGAFFWTLYLRRERAAVEAYCAPEGGQEWR